MVEALKAASTPILLCDLRRHLAAEFPSASDEQIGSVLETLVNEHFLVTALRAPLTQTDALAGLCEVLRSANAEGIDEIASTVANLYAIHDELTAHSAGIQVIAQMSAIGLASRTPLLVDTVADCEVVLPEAVAREARDAVEVLYRLSPYMGGYPPWREYQTDFRARYGTGALVSVLELIADSGLGLPSGYLGSGRDRGPRQMSERDQKLLSLVQQATMTGGEIVLTDALVEHLASAPIESQRLPIRTEVGFSIRAGSLDDLSAGRFQLEITGTPRPASSMVARHAHLLPRTDLATIVRTFDTCLPDTMTAQLSFVPRWHRDENVARSTQLAPAAISIAEHHSPDVRSIALSDLAVSAEGADLHLIQISTGNRIIPFVASALEAATHSPPLARFLSEVATACLPVYGAFDFGAAGTLPYLPRVRYRRTVLAPARWLLAPDQLPSRTADQTTWDTEFAGWRGQWYVPDHVAIVDHDRVQPVDLRHRAHRMLLRARFERKGRLELHECAAPDELGWIGRAHEILLIMNRSKAVTPAKRVVPTPPVTCADLQLPAVSHILALRLYAHPDRFDDIVAEHLSSLVDVGGGAVTAWWFHRHRDLSDHRASQHLAIFMRLTSPECFADAARHVASSAQLLQRGRLASRLAFTAWQPPSGRYGHGAALDVALNVFAADSAAAIAQLRAARSTGLAPQALAATSFLDIASALVGGPMAGHESLLHEIAHSSGPLDRSLRDQTFAIAEQRGLLYGTPAGEAMTSAWQHRSLALADYSAVLSSQRDPISVLEPLLHLHHLRAVGASTELGRVTGRLARALAMRLRARSRTEL